MAGGDVGAVAMAGREEQHMPAVGHVGAAIGYDHAHLGDRQRHLDGLLDLAGDRLVIEPQFLVGEAVREQQMNVVYAIRQPHRIARVPGCDVGFVPMARRHVVAGNG